MLTTKISIKVSLENDTRRITLSEPSYELLQKTLSKLFRLNEDIFENNLIQVKYKDDENDVITISTDDEFQVAISLSYNLQPPILRLFLVHTNPNKKENPSSKVTQKPSPPQSNKPSERFIHPCFWQQLNNLFKEGTKESLETARTLLLKYLSILPNHSHHLYNLACVEALLGNLGHAVDYLEKAIQAGWNNLTHMETDTDLDTIRNLDKYKHLVTLLQKSTSPHSQKRKCQGFGQSFQWHFLQLQINNYFDIGTPDSLEVARNLLLHQLSIVPGHPIPLYNLACVEALLGDVDRALHFLEEAIHAGYRDVGHIETDKDLDGLRHLEKYKVLVASLKESGKDENPKPEKEEEPQPWGEQLKILEDMGLTDQNKNKRVLEMTQGDLTNTIQILLLDEVQS